MITITPIAGRKVIALDVATQTGACWTDGTDIDRRTWHLTPANHGAAINDLQRLLRAFIVANGCNLIVYEDAGFGAIGKGKRMQLRTMAFHAALRGAIESVAQTFGIATWKYNPSSLKSHTCGSGRAKKVQMVAAVERLYEIKCANDDEADACAMAMLAIQGIEPVGRVKKAAKKRIKQAAAKQFKLGF